MTPFLVYYTNNEIISTKAVCNGKLSGMISRLKNSVLIRMCWGV